MRPAVAPVNKRVASQQGCRTGGLEGSSLEAWRAGLEGGLQRMLANLSQPKAAAVAPVNKRIASQQGSRTGGLEAAAWRPGGLAWKRMLDHLRHRLWPL